MILRVPDYYEQFSCIADKCKDSCCIGWEINIDEDTYAYYKNATGEIGKRFEENIYQSWDGEYSFRLKEHGRCPFLNKKNLCDICIEMGEEALSEVCTEYPRFTLDYGNVFQKCLSLSCEEVGRILFSKEAPVTFVEVEQPDFTWEEEEDSDPQEAWYSFLEQAQNTLIAILQNRNFSIWERMNQYFHCAQLIQNVINHKEDVEECTETEDFRGYVQLALQKAEDIVVPVIDSYQTFDERFYIFEQMELLNQEWKNVKEELREQLQEESYETILQEFLSSDDCRENEYEQLMVYFTFRYFMQSVYDSSVLGKAKLAITFTKVIRDMDAVRYRKNGGSFSLADRIDTARIFSKEVEHSEENVAFAEEELAFS